MKTTSIICFLLVSLCFSLNLQQNKVPANTSYNNSKQKVLSDIAQTFRDGFNHNFKGQDVRMSSANFKYGKDAQFNADDLSMSSSSMIAQSGMDINLTGNLQMSNNSKIDLGAGAKINVKSATIRDSTVTWAKTAKGNIKGKWTFINSTFNGQKFKNEVKNFN